MLDEIKESLEQFGVHFDDVLPRERPARPRRASSRRCERLRDQGHVYEADGAIWLRTTDFGDDKDRVLRKSDGEPDLLRRGLRVLPGQARSAASTAW